MKSFDQFKTIAYKNAIPHTVYKDGKSINIGKGATGKNQLTLPHFFAIILKGMGLL